MPDLHQGGRGRNGRARQCGAGALGADEARGARRRPHRDRREADPRAAGEGAHAVRQRARLPRRRAPDRHHSRLRAVASGGLPRGGGPCSGHQADGGPRPRAARAPGPVGPAGRVGGARRARAGRSAGDAQPAHGPGQGACLADALRRGARDVVRARWLAGADAQPGRAVARPCHRLRAGDGRGAVRRRCLRLRRAAALPRGQPRLGHGLGGEVDRGDRGLASRRRSGARGCV